MTGGEARPVADITLIGCGGIGGHLARHLCHFLHAERRHAHLVLVDGDRFEDRNRSRMRWSGALANKATVMARELAGAFGDVVTVEPVPHFVTPENVHSLVHEGGIVFLTVDNHATRRLVATTVESHCDVVLLSGGNDGVEPDAGRSGTYGNVQLVWRRHGAWRTSALTRHHPEIAEATDELPVEPGCGRLAVAGAPQLLFTNLAVASAMLNAFYGLLHGVVDYEEVYLDIARNLVRPVARQAPEAR
jgi:hypothetical protein